MSNANGGKPIHIEMPAGTYYVGDPCYVFERPSWELLGAQTDWFTNPVATLNGRKMLAFGTAYGDGVYEDGYHNEYPVDAGLIGVVPIEMIEKSHKGYIVVFSRPFYCSSENGRLSFDQIVIDTNPQDEDDDRE